MKKFTRKLLKDIYISPEDSTGEDNGQITIIGNSDLFHGPLIFALKSASRIVDMVFFTSPFDQNREITAFVKSEVPSFIWVPFDEVDKYIQKSDACLIGPGFKRFSSENSEHKHNTALCDEDCQLTRKITKDLLIKYPNTKWVIDAGSLQVMDCGWLPKNAIVTPNKKEFELLFGEKASVDGARKFAKKFQITILLKGKISYVVGPDGEYTIEGGNAGLTKGGTGDVLAGLVTALYAKNNALLSAAAASFVQKKAAEEMALDVGNFYNASDLADQIPYTFKRLTSN